NWGNIFAYHPLPDGRVYAGGRYKRANAPNDTLFLARFLPDGSLDPTFAPPSITMGGLAADYGPLITWLQPWPGGHLIASGEFGSVNQMSRESIFLLDSTGAVTAAFDNFHVGIYQGQFGANASINWITSVSTDTLYICGAYIGLNDGTTNDPQQRFVSRLLVSGLGVGVENVPTHTNLQLWPNPVSGTCMVELEELPPSAVLIVRDALGRERLRQPVRSHSTTLDLHTLSDGLYFLELRTGNERLAVQRLVVQH
ncbi:MAG TPA: T9SS type A sorting domain-containing protein, partial [Flavobacteriales bacterium]|nr:T9SS type A sorting domain-containing protein [Flavobacteriales bacterium]